jgi:uncharacterized protein YegL
VSGESADARSKAAALAFSGGVRWITPDGPVEIDRFHWDPVSAGGGLADLGAACKALNEKLSTKAFMRETAGSFAPVIFLMSGSEPAAGREEGLNLLKQNNWFKAGVKAAVAIGDKANQEALKAFTGGMEAVLETHNPGNLKKIIKFVSVLAFLVASANSRVSDSQTDMGDGRKQQELNAALRDIRAETAAPAAPAPAAPAPAAAAPAAAHPKNRRPNRKTRTARTGRYCGPSPGIPTGYLPWPGAPTAAESPPGQVILPSRYGERSRPRKPS